MKQAALTRIFGFEILPAPFVVSHLQLGLFLQTLGSPLDPEKNERVGVYLTNALTGWEPPAGPQKRLTGFFDLEAEREAARDVKRTKPILVVLGNPPYNAFAGTSPAGEYGLVEPYKVGLESKWGVRRYNLDDLYVRFFRIAERRIADETGRGLICYISNYSYVGHRSFVVMRERLLSEFQEIWIDNMNGDSRENYKVTPAGEPDPSVFSTESNKEGIRVGTAVCLLVRNGPPAGAGIVRFRNFWGKTKRADLLHSFSSGEPSPMYSPATPDKTNYFSFHAHAIPPHYLTWPTLAELAEIDPISGPQEARERAFIVPVEDRPRLDVLRAYLDPSVSNDQVSQREPRLMKGASGFDPVLTRANLLGRKIKFDSSKIIPYVFKPFDLQLAYLDAATQPSFFRPRPELIRIKAATECPFIISRDLPHVFPEGPPVYYSAPLMDFHSLGSSTKLIPTLLAPGASPASERGLQTNLHGAPSAVSGRSRANLSSQAREYLASIGVADPDSDSSSAAVLWLHALAIGYSPRYIVDNEEGLRIGWPRIPLPQSAVDLLASAALGKRLALLLDPASEVPGVTSGQVGEDLSVIARVERVGGGSLNSAAGEYEVTVGWGRGNSIIMPGSGKVVERGYTTEERDALVKGDSVAGRGPGTALRHLGDSTVDVYLNQVALWRNVPQRVWEFRLAGSQVCRRWLSYRERSILGRGLTPTETSDLTNIIRRIAAILLLEPELDQNYSRVTSRPYGWTS